MRTLGIDWGTRRIGLALSDEGGRLATPYDVLRVSKPERAIALICAIIDKESIRRLVVGVPLNMDGTIGAPARAAIAWTRNLKKGIPVVFVDERLSSFDAEQQIISRKRAGEPITRQRKQRQLDALSAAAFLQAFLDGRLPALPIDEQTG